MPDSQILEHLVSFKGQYLAQYSSFLIYINDIAINIKSEIWLFAAILVLLYKVIASPTHHLILQNDLNILIKWASDWLMELSMPKCSILQFTLHHNKSCFIYKMSDIPPLSIIPEHLSPHHKLSWDPHINYIWSVVSQFLGFLKSFTYCIYRY